MAKKYPEDAEALYGFQDMVGKTVARVTCQEVDPRLFIQFTDDTYIVIRARARFDGTTKIDVEEAGNLSKYDKVCFQLITQKEFERRSKASEARLRSKRLKQEEAEFNRLFKKYGHTKESKDE